jgi:hypothetical protein
MLFHARYVIRDLSPGAPRHRDLELSRKTAADSSIGKLYLPILER